MYRIIYARGYLVKDTLRAIEHGDYITVAPWARNMEEAKELRSLAGDIVVDSMTMEIVKDPSWLWDWEKEQKEKSYAWRLVHSM